MTDGGGASRSTEPAHGSSAATDVSLREFSARETWWLDRFYGAEVRHLRELRNADKDAVTLALNTAKDLAEKHNDLIRAGEKKDETYATKEDVNRLATWQSKITGALLLLGFIGVANAVRLWSG